MKDKLKILNNIKIDTDEYKEVKINDKEDLKIKMQERLKSSKRMKKKRVINNRVIGSVAVIGAIVIGVGIINPTLADNLKKRLPEFETMLDKINESIKNRDRAEYNPELYPEIEEEKKEHRDSKLVATPINVSSKSNGLKITINNAMYDKKKLYLDMTLKTDEPFKESKYKNAVGDSPYGDGIKQMYIDDLQMYINDARADGYSSAPGIVEFIDDYSVNLSYLIELDPTNDIEDAKFKLNFCTRKYKDSIFNNEIQGRWDFDFNIKSIDDSLYSVEINEKDGDYTLKEVDLTETYVEIKMELPFQPGLGNPHNNFIIIHDDKGRELEMSTGADGDNKMYTQINELVNIGEIPKYIDILVCENYGQEDNPISSFRVELK